MAVSNEYIDIFNECIDRLHQGDEIHVILDDYPEMASQLRPMLETGRAINRIAYPSADVQAAQQRVEPAVQRAITGSSGGIWWIVSVLVIAGLGAGFWLAGTGAGMSAESTPTASPAAATVTAVPVTPSAVMAVTDDATPDTSDTLFILEGPVSRMTADSLTIYNTDITIPRDDARFAALQPGDVIRIEVEQRNDGFLVVDFQLRNATLVISGSGDVWRDDNCNNPPPAWVSGGADGWRQRCLPPNSQPRGRGGSAASDS